MSMFSGKESENGKGYVELKNVKEETEEGRSSEAVRAPKINMRTSVLPFDADVHVDEEEEGEIIKDQVQFGAAYFFATEDEAKAVIDVMRIGNNLHTECSVSYATEDGSALAGDKYTHVEGVCEFKPGEVHKSFEVPVTEDDNFDTTLEFGVLLTNPTNCELGMYMDHCRVLIIDNDVFPSNDLTDAVKLGTTEALQDVGIKLLLHYMKFTFMRVHSIWWKTVLVIIIDQLNNVYYFVQIQLRIYLVDVVLNVSDDSTDSMLIFKGERFPTAVALGIIYFAPFIFLLIFGYIKAGPLDMGCDIRKHLRVNLFRKYLNYSEESLEEVHLSDISGAMKSDIPDIVENGYLMLFELLQGIGKIVVVGIILLLQDLHNCLPLLIFPAIMMMWMTCRQSRQIKLASSNSHQEASNQELLVRTVQSFPLITDYRQRSVVVRRYEYEIEDQRSKAIAYTTFSYWNEQLIPLITFLCIAVYIMLGSREVLRQATSLGSFLATINVYKDLGERFEAVYENLHNALKTIDPLISLTKMLNKPTDLKERMERTIQRREFLKKALHDAADENSNAEMFVSGKYHSVGQQHERNFFDKLPIALDRIQIGHVSALHRVSARIAQGNIVLICGPHSSGKGTLVHLLTDNRTPKAGVVLCPSYLRCLHVSYQPEMVTYMSLYENLIFGAQDPDYDRVKRIFERVVLGIGNVSNNWMMARFEEDAREYFEMQREDKEEKAPSKRPSLLEMEALSMPWHKLMSNNERKRVHFARALIYNPEVLVLHRPVDEVDYRFGEEILTLLREFVEQRGLELPEEEWQKRRPRTVFFTGGEVKKEELMEKSDIMWHLSPKGLIVQHKGYKSFTRGGSRKSMKVDP